VKKMLKLADCVLFLTSGASALSENVQQVLHSHNLVYIAVALVALAIFLIFRCFFSCTTVSDPILKTLIVSLCGLDASDSHSITLRGNQEVEKRRFCFIVSATEKKPTSVEALHPNGVEQSSEKGKSIFGKLLAWPTTESSKPTKTEEENLVASINDNFLSPIKEGEYQQPRAEAEKPPQDNGTSWFKGLFASPAPDETQQESEIEKRVKPINDGFPSPIDEVTSDGQPELQAGSQSADKLTKADGDTKPSLLASIFPSIFGKKSSASLPEKVDQKSAAPSDKALPSIKVADGPMSDQPDTRSRSSWPELSKPESEDEKLAVAINDSFLAPIKRSEDDQSDVETEGTKQNGSGWFEGFFVTPARKEMLETESDNDSFFPPHDETLDPSKLQADGSPSKDELSKLGDKKSSILANIFPGFYGQESSASSLPGTLEMSIASDKLSQRSGKAAAKQPRDAATSPETPMMPEKIHPLEGNDYSSKPGRLLGMKRCIKEILMTAVISVALTSLLLSGLYSVVQNYL
jgi:hypothetical protein